MGAVDQALSRHRMKPELLINERNPLLDKIIDSANIPSNVSIRNPLRNIQMNIILYSFMI